MPIEINGVIVPSADDIAVAHDPDNYDPDTADVEAHLVAIDEALDALGSTTLPDSGVVAGDYSNPILTISEKGIITDAADGPSAGAPNQNEQLGVTGASIAVAGISATTSVVMHFRNGVLQNSDQYTLAPNTITPTAAGGGAYDDEDLQTFWWD